MTIRVSPRRTLVLTPVAAACMLAPLMSLAAAQPQVAAAAAGRTYVGIVTASAFIPGSATGNPTLKAGRYAGATVFFDTNGNGVLDANEVSTTTDATGRFQLTAKGHGQLVADIGTSAVNTATGTSVPSHLILRASEEQIADQGDTRAVISALSSELQRRIEANHSTYAVEKANLARRLAGPAFNKGRARVADVLADTGTLSGADRYALLYEENALTNRYTYATTKLDRHDLYPDALAVPGGDPRLAAFSGSITPGETIPTDTRKPITFQQSQQAAFNVEGVPAYDNIFVIIEENKSSDVIIGNPRVPYVNQLLNTYNQLKTYYSTGNPSEPNYSALGGGDDFGITDDNWFGCGAVPGSQYQVRDVAFPGGTASDGQSLPATGALPPLDSSHLAGYSSTAGATCSTSPTGGTVHNIPGDNLFTLLSKAGLTARTYSESMNPGQDARSDSVAQNVSEAYSGTDIDGTTVTDSKPYPMPGGLYKVKHGPSIAWQNSRILPEFYADNRTIFGSQYTEDDWKNTSPYTTANGGSYDVSKWVYDQFSQDVANGDVGNINFVVPDQCDDMHGVGTDTESCNGGASSNNAQNPSVTRADIYLNRVIGTIQGSALWKNPQKRVAIVVMFDEGEGGSNGSCCGWNAGGTNSGNAPVSVGADGNVTKTTPPANYSQGNFGHGNSIFAVVTNQQDLGKAAKGVSDTDAYSHFSFVRTLQDMFGLADPTIDGSYLNRAKYTELFVASNILALPEYAGSADTHFDSVRPINHAYQIPAGYTQKLYPGDIVGVQDPTTGKLEGVITPQVGPDATQANVWSAK